MFLNKTVKKALVSLALLVLIVAATFVLTELGVLPALYEEPIETQAIPDAVPEVQAESGPVQLSSIPPYTGDAYIALNDNMPLFTEEEKLKSEAFEFFSDLDALGRCGMTMSCVGQELMPEEERGEIGLEGPVS